MNIIDYIENNINNGEWPILDGVNMFKRISMKFKKYKTNKDRKSKDVNVGYTSAITIISEISDMS